MAARQEADERFGAALDRVAAGLAEPFAAREIVVDLGGGERLERDDRVGDPGSHLAGRVDHADRGQTMVAPARQLAEQVALDFQRVGGRQDAAAERDRRVAGKHDLALGARNGAGLLDREAKRVRARRFGLARRFVDVGRFHARRHDAEPREQVAPAGRGRG